MIKLVKIKLPTNEFQTFLQFNGGLLPLADLAEFLVLMRHAAKPEPETKVIQWPHGSLVESVA